MISAILAVSLERVEAVHSQSLSEMPKDFLLLIDALPRNRHM